MSHALCLDASRYAMKAGFQRENYAKARFARHLYTGCDAREQQLRPIFKKAT